MEKDFNTSANCDSSHLNDTESEQSIVGKFKSIINYTPLSKWFRRQDDNRSTIRRRDEEFEDEDLCQMQPPSKRVKLPSNERVNDCDVSFEAPSRPLTTNDSTSAKKFKYFPEPVAGPSGIKSRKTLNAVSTSVNAAQGSFSSSEILNGHKDSDSEESTSGYSSVARISSKEHVCQSQESSKQTSPTQNSATPNNARAMFPASNTGMNRSLFTERTSKQNMNTSMSSRRPSFNVSTFGSPNFMDKTLTTKKIINSPFYNGRTVYGGASAYGRSLGRTTQDLRQNLKNSVHIKPVNQSNENGDLVLGKTARRILETLEKYSSPVNDAKKIPIAAKKQPKDGMLTRYIGANPYLVRESRVASNKELQVPSVLDLLQLKQKTRLQDVTETVKQIAKCSKSDLNTENYKLITVDNDKPKHTGKIKTKVSSVRQKQQADDVPVELNLKPVSLPITTLPKFDIEIPPPVAALPITTTNTPEKSSVTSSSITSSSSLASTVSLESKPSPKLETEKTVQINKLDSNLVEYKFSNPLIIAENLKSIVAMNNFKFSEPLCKKRMYETLTKPSLNFKMPDNKSPMLVPTKNNGESGVKPIATLKSGSVLDVLSKKSNDSLLEKFKPEEGTWECGTCMIRNQRGRSKCAACETARSVPKTTSGNNKNDFGSQFKMTSDKWECGTCLVRNDNAEFKCVSCSASKPFARNAFKITEDTWECPTCMIRNKNDAAKCAACETANPKSASSSSASTKVSSSTNSTWECSCCLVRNKEDAVKCIACEAVRKTATKPTDGFGTSFKLNNDEWECCVCMVRNKSTNDKCQCCEAVKPGGVAEKQVAPTTEQKSTLKFNFGIDKAAATAFNFGIPAAAAAAASLPKPAVNPASIFGEGSKSETTPTPTFSFGIAKDQPKTALSIEPTEKVAPQPAAQKTNPLLKPNEKLPEKAAPAPTGFKFEVPTGQMASSKPPTTLSAVTTTSETPMFNYTPTSTMFSQSSFIAASAKPSTNAFSFGAKPTAAATPLVASVGQVAEKPATAAPIFAFGAGSKPVEAPTSSVNNGFGKANATSFNMPASTFSSEVKPFSFKNDTSGTGEPVSKAPMFSFGQSAGKAPFNFSQSTNTPAFNFTGGKTDSTSSSVPAPLFGAGSTSGKNGTFNFGTVASNNNSQKAVFSFGAPASNAASPAANSGFNFGSAATAPTPAPASGGFNFSAGAPPSFDVNAKPSFNFTDGSVTTFAAQPTAEGGVAMAPRKIKKAVRRTQR